MSSLEKRQANRRGSTHGPRKCSNGISDTSSVGSFMDDTDREVSSLTDRAFRSLCIGEDAIYNDLEVSSPADQRKACAQDALQKKDLKTNSQEFSSHCIQYEETERKPELASTFQHSCVDVAQEHVLGDKSLSYISNGCMEGTWQQKRSASRVSSLIKAFSSGENCCDSGAPDTVQDKYQDFNNELWDKSALLSIQRELSEVSSGYHLNFKSGPLQSHGNNIHAVARMNSATCSKTKSKALNTNNLFFHSEFSPFQLWKDYNRFPFERNEPSGVVSATGFPRWYDSPLYKELTATHRILCSPADGRQFTRRKIEDVAASQRSRSTVIQKASAIEKRCESEMASNCPPWKNNNLVKNKLPSNRPSTVSPTNEKVHRPDSSLLYHSRHTYEIQHKVGKVGSSEMSNRTTPFNITQLLTPVIPGRQETETSEILQFAHTPLSSECDSDPKAQSDVKQLRDSYKSKASSLLFNLKDNRKRVKSTYSPTKFKISEISDMNNQPSKQEGCESRLSETSGSKVFNQDHATAPGVWELCNPVQSNDELSFLQITDHKQCADKSHNNMTLVSRYGTTNSNISYLGSQNTHPNLLTNRESEHYEVLTNSGHDNSRGSPMGHINDSMRTFCTTRLEKENISSKEQLPAHMSADMSAKHTFCSREDEAHQNFIQKEGRNFVKKASFGYNQMVNNNGIKDALPYKGEIATLIEMDKQRKATAKQYLPLANESYTMRKEMCTNKVNENVNGSWLPKEKQIQDTESSFQTYAEKRFSNKQVKDDHTNTPATSQHLYEFQHNGLQKMVNSTRGSGIITHEKAEVCLQRSMKHATSDIETAKDYSQRTQFLQSVEEKYRYNEGSVAYQPYKYESNKQWHIATTENRHTMDEECMSRQLQQSEMKAEQPGESNYAYPRSSTSCMQQQSTAYSARTSQRNWITEDRAKTEEHKPTSQIYNKQSHTNTDLNIPNTQRTLQNNNSSQARGDRFNINDILSVRDSEQAKRIRENKSGFNGRVGDPTKLENLTSPVTSDVAEDIAAKSEPSNVQSRAQRDGKSHSKHENTNASYGYVRKESHIPNDVKERPGKDIFISNENDKITLRALSYKEKGQNKHEILASKLKAHAQKEISAIKEKGLAKHAIPSRNPIKQSSAISNDKGQINQEVLSPQKEITAEKLNHLFQDITYSSVPLYKEQRNHGKGEPKYESLTAEKVELLTRERVSETVATEKERTKIQMIKSQEEVDKKNCEVQKFVKNYVHQLNMQSKENQLLKPSKDNETEPSTNDSVAANGTNPAKSFSSSPKLKVFSNEESLVKTEDKTLSNLPKPCTSNDTEHSSFKQEVLVKAATNRLALYNISGEAITLESSVNKAKEQLSNVNTAKPTADSNTPSLKCYDLVETTKSKNGTRKESPLTLPNARDLEINTRQDKTPTVWMKADAPAVEKTAEFTETAYSKTAFPNTQTVNTEQEKEHLQSGVSENQTVLSEILPKTSNQVYFKPNTEPTEKETWLENQDIQAEAIQTCPTNEDASLQQLQHTDAHASKDLGYQTSLSFNKPVSIKLDSSEEYKYSLQHEPQTKQPHSENSEVLKTVSQFQLKISQDNQNQQMIMDKEVTENNNQQVQEDGERAPDIKPHNQKAKDFQEPEPTEKKQSNDDIRIYSSNDSKSPCSEHEKSDEKLFMPNITTNSKDQEHSGQPAADKSAEKKESNDDITNPVPESHVIHIASKEDSSPTNEPVIYSICVSSTSEAVSEDEPVIYSISVSSLSDASMNPGPENQEKNQIEQVEKDDKETFGNKNKESDFLESKEDSKEVKLILNNDMAEEETVVRKYDSPTSKDKLDYYRSTEVDNISSSYESLLAKYGLPNEDTIHVESDQKEQDKNQGNEKDEKEESIPNALQKTQNNTIDGDHSPIEKLTSADSTKKHSPESRKSKTPEASPELLRNADKTHEQHVPVSHSEQEHQVANEVCTQRGDGVVNSDRNTKQDVSANQEILMSKVVPACEDFVDTQAAKQIVENGNVQMKENKQVGQNAQTMETGQKENDDDVVNKNNEMVQAKCETDSQLTAGFSSSNISNNSINYSCDDSSQPSSKISTNDCQVRIKTPNTGMYSIHSNQNAINQTFITKSPTLKNRTQEECVGDAFKQEKASKEHIHSEDNKALQKDTKEMLCKSKFPELEQVKSNDAKVSRLIESQKEISNFNNERIEKNSCGNQNQIIHAFSTGKTDQSVPDIPLEDKKVHKKDIKSQMKTDTVSTSGAALPNNVTENAQNKTSANVIGIKASYAPGLTDDDTERPENVKWKREPTQKEREIIRYEVTSLNKDAKTVLPVIKDDKNVECESSKSEKNQKEAKAQPQTSGKILRDKHDQISIVNHPEKDAIPERKGNTYDGKNTFESNPHSKYHDTVLSKQEGTFTKSEVTQREKKTTRPEISALADYARLRVIAAEDDTITEKDLLQKMNTYRKYNLSAGEPKKANFSMPVGDTEQSKQPSVNKKSENLNATTTPSQVHERRTYKITDEIPAGHKQCLPRGEINAYPKVGSLSKSSDDRVCAVKDTESTKEKTSTTHMQSNTKQSLTAQDYRYSRSHEVHQPQNPRAAHPVHTQVQNKNDPSPQQPLNANMLERKVNPQVKKSQCEAQVSIETEFNNANRHTDNQIKEEVKDEETSEELQYYIVNAMESEKKPKNNQEAHSLSNNICSKKDLTEIQATVPRSNTSSPATGKPIMFRVKDNTGKPSSVTKTVRPRFHRSFSEEFSICSPVDSCYGSEKDKVDYDNENDSKEFANSPVLHEQSVTSHRFSSLKEIQARNRLLSPGFMAPKEPRSYNRRSQVIEGDESRSLMSTVSEDVRSLATSSAVMTNSRDFNTEHVRRTYARPVSSCYERPESACYERPESACSDMRPASKPPTVPPKTDKALRRAKRLTSRRIRQVEDKVTSDTQVQPESKSIRTVSSLPASPMVQMSTSQSVQSSPPISHYHVEPNYAPPAPSIVAHSFPMTQRKFLQDPNSGQIFMVDMPVQVKTKTFFDPETGKYLQLNVRQRAQSTLSQPASLEVLSHPYVVYPGFLPMPVSVSSAPSVRSSSQMSAPATLTEDLNNLKASHEPSEQENPEPERPRNVQQQKRPVCRTREQTGREILHTENVRMTPRQTHIITMSELEDFAIENT
ncbi:uncharacterized protein LOC131345427 [Hemibagrus wyckioides]|uniref:uncharacterized protein LOC131345427 n=1 Tax=Hemibagrus wyckioides TaxID=337641 RepID=UPI00266D375E|nr:uncharacterized protein LOC131345427 [Hemibagrus wyckioides]XP_058234307.1 uncharacterized protein LOC131345427 [Hemibagrus wyckioides]